MNNTLDNSHIESIGAKAMTNDDMKKIDILLTEYESLRKEQFHRATSRFAVMGLIFGVGGYILVNLGKTDFLVSPRVLVIVGIILGAIVLGVWIQLGQLMWRCGVRLGDIERRINRLAGDDPLLIWAHRISSQMTFPKFHEAWAEMFGGDVRTRPARLWERGEAGPLPSVSEARHAGFAHSQ